MNSKIAYYISVGFLGLLLVGSLIFFKERMLFIDPAFISFEIINQGSFVFSEHRYGAFITQIFPLSLSYLGAPLKIILLGYSVSFYLFYFLTCCILGFFLKQYKLAILFVFYLCLMVSDSYFWPNNEIHQAVGWMILFLGCYKFSLSKDWKVNKLIHVAMISFLFLACISHLLIAPSLLFLWLYHAIDNPKTKVHLKEFIFYSGLTLLFIALRYWLSKNSWYDGVKLEGVKQINLENVSSALKGEQVSSFLKLLWAKYWTVIILFITGSIYLIRNKKLIQLLLTIFCALGYFFLVALTYKEAITANNLFYYESQWMGLALIMSAPFLFEALKWIKNIKLVAAIFLLIFCVKIPHLLKSHEKFEGRLANLESLVENAESKNINKAYIFNKQELTDDFILTWGLPVESILLSSMNGKNNSISIKAFDSNTSVSTDTDSIYTAFKHLPGSELNKNYFNFKKVSKYEKLLD